MFMAKPPLFINIELFYYPLLFKDCLEMAYALTVYEFCEKLLLLCLLISAEFIPFVLDGLWLLPTDPTMPFKELERAAFYLLETCRKLPGLIS